MSKTIGIDLGTTNSCVCVYEGGEAKVIANAEGERTTPSVVAFKGDDIIVGAAAKRQAITNPDKTIISIKREMGTDHKVSIDGKDYTPQEISAMILQKLKADAEGYLGESVSQAVITVPAYFNDAERQATKDAGKIAGLEVLRIINEPTAAALAYGIDKMEDAHKVLVYDLGHGTFDTAVVTAQSEGTPYVLHSKAGLPEIGGKNFDEILYQELVNVLEEQYDYVPKNERMREIVREEAINKKIELSDNEIVSASVFNGNDYYDVELTRERFEELTEHLLIQTLELVQDVLNESSSAGIKIDAIVLSGGASQMPMVLNGLKELVEDEYPVVLYRPSEAVSFGAARFAYGISRTKPIPGLKPDSSSSQTHKNRTVKVSEKKEITTETGKSNQIMEQLTDCCYGLWMPSEDNLEGEVEFMIQSGKSRPITSDKVEFFTASSRLVLKLYRSKEKNRNLKSATIKECDSILWVPFDVIPGKKYEASITVLENYGIEVELHAETGEIVKKTTSDFLSKLI